MPKSETSKVRKRIFQILKLMHLGKKVVTTSMIADTLDCTIMQAYYALRKLEKEGVVARKKAGKRYIWWLR